MSNVIAVHGSFGKATDNWFPWLKGPWPDQVVCVPQFPVGLDKQSFDTWESHLHHNCTINEDTILIGNCAGASFICKYLTRYRLKVSKLIFVSGFNNYYGTNEEHNNANANFFVDDEQLANVKHYANEIFCLYGDNDPYIPFDVLQSFSKSIGAVCVVIPNGGHLDGGSLPQLLPLMAQYPSEHFVSFMKA